MDNNYQLSRIHNYINGLMSREDMYAFEHEALDDPLLQDAIDGYKLQHGVDVKQISLLQQRLATRVEVQGGERNKRFYSWQRLTIGMAAAVMFITVCSLLLIRYIPTPKSAYTSEILIADTGFEYSANSTQSFAIPVGDWEALYTVLNTSYSNSQNYNGSLHVSFDIDKAGRAYNILISGVGFEDDEELQSVLRNKLKWSGTKGDFVLNIKKIGH